MSWMCVVDSVSVHYSVMFHATYAPHDAVMNARETRLVLIERYHKPEYLRPDEQSQRTSSETRGASILLETLAHEQSLVHGQ